MKKIIIETILLCGIGYAILNLIGWVMSLEIPIPVLIIVLCMLIYKTMKGEING